MNESAIVFAMIALLLAAGAAALVPWELLFQAGTMLSVAGFAFGVPTGVVYHVLLYRALHPRGVLPRDWIWRPIEQNSKLHRAERRRVMPWCYAGGLGFVLIALGLVAYCLSLVSVLVAGV